MNKYFRIVGYYPAENTSVIIDSHGKYQLLWQFSSALLKKGFKIIEVSDADKFLDISITKTDFDADKIILRASANGEPERITHLLDNTTYHAIKVGDKIYIPNKGRIL